ncbi:MAG: ferrous iron transport protein A [Firmicutes bacterium]|nr:ferrous iron transport protein A [Bacillota bacterium]
MASITLADLPVGTAGAVIKIEGSGAEIIRLMDMGFTPKTKVTLFKIAPLGDPYEVILRGYHLTLRVSECLKIKVEK